MKFIIINTICVIQGKIMKTIKILSTNDGSKFWYKNGQMMRELNQPSCITNNGTKIWMALDFGNDSSGDKINATTNFNVFIPSAEDLPSV